jgi:hypothetical protein
MQIRKCKNFDGNLEIQSQKLRILLLDKDKARGDEAAADSLIKGRSWPNIVI